MRIQSKKWQTFDLRPQTSAWGFTLLELLIVISLIVVLMALLIPAFYKVKNGANDKRAQIEARIIGSAIRAYKLQEKKFPVNNPAGVADDVVYGGGGQDNSEVMTLLRDGQPPVLDVNKLRWDDDGNVIDPYGSQYKITLDLNYDGKIDGEYKEYNVE